MDRRTLTVSRPDLAADNLGFFRWGHIAGRVLVTNDAGDWAFLSEAEFTDLLAGRITDGHPLFQDLQRKGFLRDGLDLDGLAARIAQRNHHLQRGTHVHVITVTGRRSAASTDEQAGEDSGPDMGRDTAEQIVDLALQSTSPSIAFEFQGHEGEPLRNFDVLRHLMELARSRNQQTTGKMLSFRLFSNFTGMTEEAAEWLIANDVAVSTSLDGPASVHDGNRTWKGGSAHAQVVHWIDYFHRRYATLGRDPEQWHIDALLTVTRRTLDAWREVIDEYVARGLRTIHLRPLDAASVAPDIWTDIGYAAQEYLDFYHRALDYVLALNRQGVDIIERKASIFLMKILTSDDPGVVDIQSPDGAGTSQIAYGVDGRMFPCDEARIVDAMGDPIFELGNVRDLTIPDVVHHPTVRAIAAASLLDAQPMCADCWNKPFCGFSPVRNFLTQGDLFGQRTRCLECKEHMAVSARLFELLADETDTGTAEILRRWTTVTPRLAHDQRASAEAP